MRKLIFCSYHALKNLVYHDGIEHAGYMSFIVLLAVFPFIIFILAFCGFLGASDWGKDFISFLLSDLPPNYSNLINLRISELLNSDPYNVLNLAGVGIIWTISSFVECLRTIFNRIYCVKHYPHYIFRRLLSIIQFFFISILLILIILIFIFIPFVVKNIPSIYEILLRDYQSILFYFRYLFLCFFLFAIISFVYYVIPNNKIKFSEVIPGSIFAVLLWIASGKLLFKYISYYSQLSFVYGSLGSVIVTMIFFYIVNIIIIYGAEINYLMGSRK
ncbi:MAG: YihY/virulence factor BrkB family protein [Rickettsia sp.]|nr:YihY/virulence factor BrkB family protein [Rickettsia sp.]